MKPKNSTQYKSERCSDLTSWEVKLINVSFALDTDSFLPSNDNDSGHIQEQSMIHHSFERRDIFTRRSIIPNRSSDI